MILVNGRKKKRPETAMRQAPENAMMPKAETKVKPEKDKLTLEDLKKKPGGWYEFPDGEKAHGKKRALKKIDEWNGDA